MASQWFAIGLRRSSPSEIIDRLNQEINATLADARLQARLLELGTKVFPGSAAELGTFVAEETQKWAKVVTASGAKPG